MKALDCLLTRRACRKYTDQVPSRDLIEQVVNAGIYAPSGMGMQSPIVVAVTNKELRDRIAKLNASFFPPERQNMDPFYGAPAVLVVLARKNAPTYVYDGALTMGNMLNAAHALGLASCWIHRAKQVFEGEEGKAILRDLGVEGDYEGIGNCILGYAADAPAAPAPRAEGRVFFAE